MAEENGQDLLFEFFDVIDDESEAIRIPANDFLILLILNRNLGTSRISNVFDMKIEGLEILSFLPLFAKLKSSLSLFPLGKKSIIFDLDVFFYERIDIELIYLDLDILSRPSSF